MSLLTLLNQSEPPEPPPATAGAIEIGLQGVFRSRVNLQGVFQHKVTLAGEFRETVTLQGRWGEMTAEEQNLKFWAGNDVVLRIPVVDENGVVKDLTGADMTWFLGRTPDAPLVLTKASPTGITTEGAATGGIALVILSDIDTAPLYGTYYHELKVTDGDDFQTTVTAGWITVHLSGLSS